MGSPVEVKLVDDVEPLAATEAEQEGDDDDDGTAPNGQTALKGMRLTVPGT